MSDLKELQEKYQGKSFKEIPETDRQKIASHLVEREIFQNMSMMIEDILKRDENWEDVENLYIPTCTECSNTSFELKKKCNVCGKNLFENNPQEIYEWWNVSKWLYEKMRDTGDPVFTPNDFNYFWGRTGTGQTICLDYNVQQLAYETYIK